eukprot:5720897-Pleurochrysis_carterae.AAC.1
MVDSASNEVVDAQGVSANGVEASCEEASDVEVSDVEVSDAEASNEEGGWHLELRRSVERRLLSSRVGDVRVER